MKKYQLKCSLDRWKFISTFFISILIALFLLAGFIFLMPYSDWGLFTTCFISICLIIHPFLTVYTTHSVEISDKELIIKKKNKVLKSIYLKDIQTIRAVHEYFHISYMGLYSTDNKNPIIELSFSMGNSKISRILENLLLKNNYQIERLRKIKNQKVYLYTRM